MSTSQITKRSAGWVLGLVLATCLLNPPSLSGENPRPEPTGTPTPTVQATPLIELLTPVKTEIPESLRKPPVPKWYAGKKILGSRELSFLLYEAGFRGKAHRLAWIVAMGESTGRPGSFNSSGCYGLFQINMSGSLKADRLARYNLKSVKALLNPAVNARVAFHMSRQGTSWGAWTVDPYARSGHGYPGVVKSLPGNQG